MVLISAVTTLLAISFQYIFHGSLTFFYNILFPLLGVITFYSYVYLSLRLNLIFLFLFYCIYHLFIHSSI